MSRSPLIAARRVAPLEGLAWYWLWSGTLCLWLVPAAREHAIGLIAAPLTLLVLHFVLSQSRRWATSLQRSSSMMTSADLAAFARHLRASRGPAPAPVVTRPRARARTGAARTQRIALSALFSR